MRNVTDTEYEYHVSINGLWVADGTVLTPKEALRQAKKFKSLCESDGTADVVFYERRSVSVDYLQCLANGEE